MKGTYRIIDRRRRHGLIRLCLAGRPDPGYTGDDWDDSPYERNAGPVCQDFVDATPTLAVPWGPGGGGAGGRLAYAEHPLVEERFQLHVEGQDHVLRYSPLPAYL